ncbi:MAG: copper homeostasis protein CutC [Aquaticitalea sp.]
MKLEICASNYESAINAEKAGAHRIELCSELAIGGITPTYGFIKQVMKAVKIPVFVLIRPRSGNFTYSDEEFDFMKKDIKICKDLGCAGIASGILNIDNSVDIERTKELVELSRPLEFTFHRAFDWTLNPYVALKQLIELKVDRILTSGQESSAEKGIFVLQQLKKLANGQLKILPGGGINLENVLVFKGGGFEEVHCSAIMATIVNPKPKVSMISAKFFDETISFSSDVDLIQSILYRINGKA